MGSADRGEGRAGGRARHPARPVAVSRPVWGPERPSPVGWLLDSCRPVIPIGRILLIAFVATSIIRKAATDVRRREQSQCQFLDAPPSRTISSNEVRL